MNTINLRQREQYKIFFIPNKIQQAISLVKVQICLVKNHAHNCSIHKTNMLVPCMILHACCQCQHLRREAIKENYLPHTYFTQQSLTRFWCYAVQKRTQFQEQNVKQHRNVNISICFNASTKYLDEHHITSSKSLLPQNDRRNRKHNRKHTKLKLSRDLYGSFIYLQNIP